MNRVELKTMAKAQIKGNIGILFLMLLLVGVIASVANVIPVVGSLAVTPVLGLALVKVYLKMTEGVKPAIGDLFSCLDQIWASFKVTILTALFTSLWSMLFVIPGIIKSISYSMAMYILAENPNLPALEAINRSKAMMEGHKMEMFVLQLSFIGWHLLGGITFGIAYIWILPYMNATMANFYNKVKAPAEVVG